MEEYSIIRLVPEDYHKCGNIWNMSGQKNTSRWFDELVDGNRIVFVYTVNGIFLGEGALVMKNGDRDYTIPDRRIYLSRMIVKKECRNRGIGGVLVDYLVDYAKKLGYAEMSVGVDIDNLMARHLYNKKGFQTVLYEGEDQYGKFVKLLKVLED